MIQSTFDRWLLGASGLVGLLLVAMVLAFQNTRTLHDHAGWISHSHEVIDTLEATNAHLHEAQTAQRTYVIVGGESFPPAFAASVDAARKGVQRVRTLTGDNPEQQARIPDLENRVDELEAYWLRVMRTRREQGFEAAQRLVAAGTSSRMLSEWRTCLKQMNDSERELLRIRLERRNATYQSALFSTVVSGVVGIGGVVSFSWLLRRHLADRIAAARVIAEQGERLRTTLASIGDAVIVTDLEGRITNMNAVAERLTGWTKDSATGRPLDQVFRIVNEKTRQPVPNPAAKALNEGIVIGLANHTILIASDGTEHPIDDSAAPIRCKEGEIVGCVLVFRDVTERRRQERDLAEQQGQFRTLAESIPQLAWMANGDGHIFWYNRRWYEYTGTTFEQMEGWGWQSVHDPEVLPLVLERWKASIARGEPLDMVFPIKGKDGKFRPFLTRVEPLRDERGRVLRWFGTNTDISDRTLAESERQKFVALAENSVDFIGMCDLQGVPFYVNRAGLKLVGLDSLEEAKRTPVRDFFFPEDQTLIMDEFFPSVLKQGHGAIDIRFRNFKTGEARWMAYKVFVVTDAQGHPGSLATVSQDVTERRRLEDDLRKLAADLSEADRQKDEFLATLAHELRNPLAPIRNALQILKLSPSRDAEQQARAMMERQLEQMVRLVDDLLDVSRITRGKLELRTETVALSAVVNSAVETSRPIIDRMEHTLTVTMPDESLLVQADLTRLAQVFSNLLNNSAKYMDRRGQIWLTAERQENEVVVTVKDTGIGIDAEHLPRIFEMFSQVHGSLERSQGGLGIGLTLVKRLVEMHGGRVEVRSEGPGKGAEFAVHMPILAPSELPPGPAPKQQPAPGSSLRILIVDDNRDSADSLRMLLRLLGNDTRTAYDGEEGVQVAREFHPDVVLLDIGLPRLNGYEACRRIRELPGGSSAVLIAVTGWGQEDDRLRSREAGFDHHLVKPVDPQELTNLIARLQPAKAYP